MLSEVGWGFVAGYHFLYELKQQKVKVEGDAYVNMLNCKINGTVHIFFLKKSYLSPRWTDLPQFLASPDALEVIVVPESLTNR